MKKTLLSGIKPTGKIHIGNYFGAIKQWVDLVKGGGYESFVMVADYHALNFIQNKEEMQRLTHELVVDYLAVGLDPEKITIFKQSDVSAHTELTWIFDTLVTVPFLERAHAYKDAQAKNKEISMGTFNYPVLMAADILLYSPDVVPVGSDQKQHVEYARDIAEKFNFKFGETFKLPKDLILGDVATVPGIDGQKMSKSYNNTIPLFASDEEIEKSVMSIVTDSGADVPANVYAIHKLLKTKAELTPLYEANKGKYQSLKQALITDLKAFVGPLRARREEILHNPTLVKEALEMGAKKAREVAESKLLEAKRAIGVI